MQNFVAEFSRHCQRGGCEVSQGDYESHIFVASSQTKYLLHTQVQIFQGMVVAQGIFCRWVQSLLDGSYDRGNISFYCQRYIQLVVIVDKEIHET